MSLENINLSPENLETKKAVGFIESIKTGSEQRAQIILVRLGLKPATELVLYPGNSSEEEAETFLKKSGLVCLKRENKEQKRAVAEYVVAKDRETAEKLLNCNSPTEYGMLMGYPETAVQAFETKDIYKGPLPEDVESSIFQLKFSKEHFADEFETVRKWNRALAEYRQR
jgi:hypothetical protein